MAHLLQFTVSPVELFARGSIIYWFLFLLFRFLLRRDTGSLGLADILVVVVIADAAQNGMAGEYKSVSDAFVLVGTLAGWNYLFDRLSYRFPPFARFAEPQPVVFIENGRIVKENLHREMVTLDELASQLRQHGIEDTSEVKHAALEPDGHVSVIPYRREP